MSRLFWACTLLCKISCFSQSFSLSLCRKSIIQDMTTVTVREFRANIKKYFDLADKGEQVVVRRGSAQYYMMPVNAEDLEFSQDMQSRIDAANRQIIDLVNSEEDDPRQMHIDFD